MTTLTPPLPDRALIGSFEYRITGTVEDWNTLQPEVRDDSWGYTEHETGTIYVRHGLNAALTRTIVLHEVLHACAFAAGTFHDGDRSEEEWVHKVAPPLMDALRRSPGLAAYLLEGADL